MMDLPGVSDLLIEGNFEAALDCLSSYSTLELASVRFTSFLSNSLSPLIPIELKFLYEKWIISKARLIQVDLKNSEWALSFFRSGLNCTRTAVTPAAFAQEALYKSGPLSEEARRMESVLEELFYLQNSLRVYVPVTDFDLDCPAKTAVSLLESTPPGMLEAAIEGQYVPYAKHVGLDDTVLSEYAISLLDSDSTSAASIAKLVVLLAAINDPLEHARVVIEVLRRIPFGIPDKLLQHARRASVSNPEAADALRLHAAQGVIAKYCLPVSVASSGASVRLALQYVASHALEKDDAISDALTLAVAFPHIPVSDVYEYCLSSFLRSHDLERALKALKSVPGEILTEVACQISNACLSSAQTHSDLDDSRQQYLYALEFAREGFRSSADDAAQLLICPIDTLMMIVALYDEFNICTTPLHLATIEEREGFVMSLVESKYYTESFYRICQLAQCCHISAELAVTWAVTVALPVDSVQAMSLFSELLLMDVHGISNSLHLAVAKLSELLLVTVCEDPLRTLAANMIFGWMQLQQRAIVRCNNCTLLQNLNAFLSVEIVAAIFNSTSAVRTDEMAYEIQLTVRGSLFAEGSLVMDAMRVMPLLQHSSDTDVILQLSTLLSDNNCGQLALRMLAVRGLEEQHGADLLLKLASSALGSRIIDHLSAVCYVGALDEESAKVVLKNRCTSVGRDYSNLTALAAVGLDVGICSQWTSLAEYFRELHLNASWWRELAAIGIHFNQDQFSHSIDRKYHLQLLRLLVLKVDVSVAIRFCRSFGIDEDEARVAALEVFLTSGAHDNWRSLSSTVASETSSLRLVSAISTMLREISGVEYEKLAFACDLLVGSEYDSLARKYLCVIRALEDCASNGKGSLKFSVHDCVDDSISTVSVDLSLENVLSRAKLVEAAGDEPDALFVAVVENVADAVSAISVTAARELLLGIRSSQRAAYAATRLAESSPLGPIRLQIFSLASVLADRWLSEAREEKLECEMSSASKLLESIRLWELRSATECMLLEVDCADLLTFASNPSDTIAELFRTKSLPALRNRDVWVHTRAQMLADRHGLKLDLIRSELVKRWLREVGDDDLSFAGRVAYLMIVDDPLRSADRLLNLVFSEKPSPAFVRSRALQAAVYLASHDLPNLIAKRGGSADALQKRLASLLYAVDLEALDVQITADQIEREPEGLARALWRDRRTDPRAVRIICMLHVDGWIHNDELFAQALSKAVSLRLHGFALGILQHFTTPANQILLIPVWAAILEDVASNISADTGALGSDDRNLLRLIVCCLDRLPCSDADLIQLASSLMGRTELALAISVVLFVSNPSKKCEVIQSFSVNGNAFAVLETLQRQGSLEPTLVQAIFAQADLEGDYSLTLTSFAAEFVTFMIERGDLNNLIRIGLRADREEDVLRLIQRFLMVKGIVNDETASRGTLCQEYARICRDDSLASEILKM